MTSKLNQSTEISEYTVSEVSKIIKTILEGSLSSIRIRGEISGFKRHGSGHLYFNLKDNAAVIKAVCWRGVAGKIDSALADGLEVICEGDISSYAAQSSYQLIVNKMDVSGEGALLKLLEERKQKLHQAGLFNKERRPLPRFPKTIGIITSASGAVIQDILRRLEERFPVTVWLWPVVVQGEETARQVVSAIKGFNHAKTHGLPLTPDLLIVARGGGSIEDLWPFNDESIVQAVFDSTIPIISAIGHETDTTLIDYAADRRAPTPTAAAEMAVPDVRQALFAQLNDHQHRLVKSLKRLALFSTHRFDDKTLHLKSAFKTVFEKKIALFESLKQRLRHPQDLIQLKALALSSTIHQLRQTHQMIWLRAHTRYQTLSQLLNSYSHEKTLERGFCLVKHNGNLITRGKNLEIGHTLDLIFYDIEKKAMITSNAPNKKRSKQQTNTQERFDF